MKKLFLTLNFLALTSVCFAFDTENHKEDFTIIRPKKNIKVWSKQISFLGSAPKTQDVKINDQIPRRNKSGHFASVMPLTDHENLFKIKIGEKTDTINVIKLISEPKTLKQPGLIKSSLTPSSDIEIMPGEHLYLSLMASSGAEITVDIAGTIKTLKEATPKNSQENVFPQKAVKYETYIAIEKPIKNAKAIFTFKYKDKIIVKKSKGKIKVLKPTELKTTIIKDQYSILRTGPSTSFGRLNPLPVGTKDYITKKEGQWLRLKYGGWIKEKYTKSELLTKPNYVKISDIETKTSQQETKIFFKLNYQVPFTIVQEPNYIKINFYGATHQSDVIRIDPKAIIDNIIWIPAPTSDSTYILTTQNNHIWGYDYYYKNNTLILSIKHPPILATKDQNKSLEGISIFLDAGHGGKDPGAIGPTGYPEKTAALQTTIFLKKALEAKGAEVITSRETDIFLPLKKRTELIKKHKPTIALSIHYNANSLDTNPFDVKGISMHWYQPHSANLANHLHDKLTENLDVRSRGVFWQTLFMTRLTTCPSVLLELGFITNPDEFDKIKDEKYQKKMTKVIAKAIEDWIKQNTTEK